MKILVLTSTYPRWENDTDPKFVYNLCKYLSQDHEVHVVAPHCKGTAFREVKDGIRIFRFRYCFQDWETLAYDGGILPRLKQNRLRIILVPAFLFSQLLLTIRLLRSTDYDVLHAHWIIPQGLIALLARPFSKTRPAVIATSHGGDLFALKGRTLTRIKRWVTRRVDHLTVVSSTMKLKAIEQGLKDEQAISVIPMGVDAHSTFLPPADASQRKGLLYVGRLVDKKGVEYLIKAMALVSQQFPRESLTIIGSGPLRETLEDECRRHGISDKVRFLGSLINTEIPEHLRSAAVTIFPSVVGLDGDQEGTPVAIMEALACGAAVVVSDYPGARDIIDDGANGHLVAQRSPEDIADRVTFLLSHPEIRASLGSNARQSALQRFDWRIIGSRYQSLFREMTLAAAKPGLETDCPE